MDKQRVPEILDFVSNKLYETKIKVHKIILFGSYYDGVPHQDSDIDIAIVSNDFIDKDSLERGRLVREIELEAMKRFDVPVDLIKLTVYEYENETRMIASYVKEGKVVYSAK